MPPTEMLAANSTFLTQLLIAAAIVILFALAARLVFHFLSTTIHRLTAHTALGLDDQLLASLRGPVFWAITLLGLSVARTQVALDEDWQQLLEGLLFVGFALTAAITLYRLLRDILDWYIHEKAGATTTTLDDLLLPFLRRVLAIVIFSATALLILQYFHVPVGSFLATLGVGSLAVALAAQAALSDIISGFLIMLDRRYRVGDRIELHAEKIIGDVTDIGLRTTRLLTMDYRVVIVPNSTIANNIVINHAYPDPTLRVDLPVGIAYGTNIRSAKAVLLNAIRHVEGVQRDRAPDIVLDSFGDSAVNLEMRCWIDAYADKPKMIDRINEAAYNALNEAGIEIPFPQSTLWHRVEREALPALRALLHEEALPPSNGNHESHPMDGNSQASTPAP